MQEYDYIFAGVGLSSLVLLNKLYEAELILNKRILLIDPNLNNTSQKHICFWNNADDELLDPYTLKSWRTISVAESGDRKSSFHLNSAYQLLNFSKFKRSVLSKIASLEGTKVSHSKVDHIAYQDQLVTDGHGNTHRYKFLFNSIHSFEADFLQQFMGYVIECEEDSFNFDRVTLMDFSNEPKLDAIEFEYILPYTEKRALVEYTLLTRELKPWNELENILKDQLSKKYPNFKIVDSEQGAIPMTVHSPKKTKFKNVIELGIGAGMQRASSGYLLNQAIDYANYISSCLRAGKVIKPFQFSARVRFYDKVFLRVMLDFPGQVPTYFYSMFRKMGGNRMFDFLSGKTSLVQEIQLMKALPTLRFTKYAFYEWFGIK